MASRVGSGPPAERWAGIEYRSQVKSVVHIIRFHFVCFGYLSGCKKNRNFELNWTFFDILNK